MKQTRTVTRMATALTLAAGMGVSMMGLACAVQRRAEEVSEARERPSKLAEVERLRNELQGRPDDIDLLHRLGKAYWALGQLQDAEEFLERALHSRRSAAIEEDLLSVLYARGHYVDAANAARRLAAQNEGRPSSWVRDLSRRLDQGGGTRTDAQTALEAASGGGFVNSIGMRLVAIPGGSFVRGDADGQRDNQPPRTITVTPYFIGQYEVTAEQFNAFLQETGFPFRRFVPQLAEPKFGQFPVAAVSWLDAEAFCIWLSAHEHGIYRLPTEAEWEFAARGPQGFREPWGNEAGRAQESANWGRTDSQDLAAAASGSFPPLAKSGSYPKDRSPFGVFDMAGNVREWCHDEYAADYYGWSPARDPYGPMKRAGLRVMRGGSWNDPGPGRFAIVRSKAPQNQAYTGFGFRIVRETGVPVTPVAEQASH